MTGVDRAQRQAALAVAAAVLAAIAAAVVILPGRAATAPPAGAAPVAAAPAAGAPADRAPMQALATWITTETDAAAVVEAPDDVRAQLVQGGVPARRLGVPGTLVVTPGPAGPGTPVARFGAGAAALTVTRPGAPADDRSARAARAGFGRQLAGNRAVTAPPEVRTLLTTGQVDPRALLLLAGMAALGPLEIVALPAAPSEDAALPRHHLALSGLDATGLDWLRAQRPPLAPSVVTQGDRATLSWPVPSPPGLIGG